MHILIRVKYMYLFFIILGFFAILGIILSIKGLITEFLRIKDQCCSTSLLLTINNSSKNQIEFETKIALSRLRWYNIKKYDNLYIVASGLSRENFLLCEELCSRYDVKLLDEKEFLRQICVTENAYEQRKIES